MNDNKPENVIDGQFFTKGNINPDKMILANIGQHEKIFMAAIDKNGDFVIGASFCGLNEALAMVKRAERRIIDMMEDD